MDTPDELLTPSAQVTRRIEDLVLAAGGQVNIDAISASMHSHVASLAAKAELAPTFDAVDLGEYGQVEFWDVGTVLVLYIGPGITWSAMLADTETVEAIAGTIRGTLTELVESFAPVVEITAEVLGILRDVVAGLSDSSLDDFKDGQYVLSLHDPGFSIDTAGPGTEDPQPGQVRLTIARHRIVSITVA